MGEDPPPVQQQDGSNAGTIALVWLFLAAVVAVLLYLSYTFTGKEKEKKKKPAASVGPGVDNQARQVAGGRRARRMRVQRDSDGSDDDGSDGDVDALLQEDDQGAKVGVKKSRKLEMKKEKKAQREAALGEREEKKKRDALLDGERKKDKEREAREAEIKAEHDRLVKEEEDRQEHEEYLQIKASFVIEESGEVGIVTEEESQSLLQEFIDYVKTSKVVLLEELGGRFNLKTQEAIERLEHLLEIGRLTGVMDDRGKFIYISEEELAQVAQFIKQRGRISIAELAESSNALVNMQGCINSTSTSTSKTTSTDNNIMVAAAN